MKYISFLTLACLAWSSSSSMVEAAPARFIPHTPSTMATSANLTSMAQNSYIVILKDTHTAASFQPRFDHLVRRHASQISKRQLPANHPSAIPPTILHRFETLPGFTVKVTSKETLEELLSMEEVDYVEEDGMVYAEAIITQRQPINWGLARLSEPKPLNLKALKNYGYKYSDKAAGQGVQVYILDSGVDDHHVEFGGRGGRVQLAPSFVEGEVDSVDLNGHGTHVAGVVGGTQYGVAKKVDLIAVKVLSQYGSGPNSWMIAGMDYVLSHHKKSKNKKRSIVNMSVGSVNSPAMNEAATRLFQAGIPIFVSAGNENEIDTCARSPGGARGAFAVQATDVSDTISPTASFGRCVSIFAPGVDIVSAYIDEHKKNKDKKTDRKLTMSGASMATPHVAGLAAVLMSGDESLRTPDQVYERIRNLATKGLVKGDLKGSPNLLAFSGAQ